MMTTISNDFDTYDPDMEESISTGLQSFTLLGQKQRKKKKKEIVNILTNRKTFYIDKDGWEITNSNDKFFKPVEDKVNEWLDLPDTFIKIKKQTQTGVTTSLRNCSLKRNLSVLHMSPTRLIGEYSNMVTSSLLPEKRCVIIGKNKEDEDSDLPDMCANTHYDPIFGLEVKGNCWHCNDKYMCEYVKIKERNYDCVCLTYAKFIALTKGSDPLELLKFIFSFDVIILDEIATTITHNQGLYLYRILKILSNIELNRDDSSKCDILINTIESVLNSGNKEVVNNPNILDFDEVRKIGDLLINKIPKYALKEFRESLLLMTHEQIIKVKNKEKGIRIMGKSPTFMDNFIKALGENVDINKHPSKIFITGAIMPDIDQYKEIKEVEMPDFNETEKTRLIVVDKANWNFVRHWDREKDKVKVIIEELMSKFEGEKKILVIAINQNICNDIESWEIPGLMAITYTYYRSVLGSGVKLDHKILICVGLPYTPIDSGHEQDINYGVRKGTIRNLEMMDTLKNTLGRGKSPDGTERSIVFVLGGGLENFKKFYPEKKEVVETVKEGTLQDIAGQIAYLWIYHERVKYTDYKKLPYAAEIVRYAIQRQYKNTDESDGIPLNDFARKSVGWNINQFNNRFTKWRYLFPNWWKIRNVRNGRKIFCKKME